MPVICAVCQTENREAAMFCHGCARKLPGFAATGPSLLDGMRSKRSTGDSLFGVHRTGLAAQNASRGFWIGLGTLMLAAALGFGGWFAYVTRKVPAPAPSAAPVAVQPLQPPLPSLQPLDKSGPSEPVPLASTLGAGEAALAADPPEPPSAATAPPQAAIQRRQTPATPASPPRTAAALDPRQGCQNLNFFAAARCEAAHCDQAAYARHRRCDFVREDRRRDEARRNPTLGT